MWLTSLRRFMTNCQGYRAERKAREIPGAIHKSWENWENFAERMYIAVRCRTHLPWQMCCTPMFIRIHWEYRSTSSLYTLHQKSVLLESCKWRQKSSNQPTGKSSNLRCIEPMQVQKCQQLYDVQWNHLKGKYKWLTDYDYYMIQLAVVSFCVLQVTAVLIIWCLLSSVFLFQCRHMFRSIEKKCRGLAISGSTTYGSNS